MAINPTELARLRAIPERELRDSLLQGLCGQPGSENHSTIVAIVAEKEAARAALEASKRDAREEETLAIAKEANRIASRAERWAMYAAIAAIIALIISIAKSTS